jgi:5'(3')-deoxyribonucleotidase
LYNKRIGVDLDEVVFNFIDPMLETFNIHENTNYKRDDVIEYSFERSGIFGAGTNKKWLEELRHYYGFENLPLMPGAKLLVHLWIGNEIIFVTSRDPKDMPASFTALQKNNLLFGPIVYCTDTLTKLDLIKQLNIQIMIDDNPAHLTPITTESNCMTILFSNIEHSIRECKWNYHARNWEKIVSIVNNLS